MRTNTQALSNTTKFMHWIVALLIIGLLASGIYMVEKSAYGLYDWHKSFGIVAILFVFGRFIWRLKEGWPEQLSTHTATEKSLSRLIQILLLISPIIMVVSGLVMAIFSGYGLDIFGFPLIASNPDPENPSQVIASNESLSSFAGQVHWIAGYIMVATLVLHIVGALKHHWIDKDKTLSRMTSFK